MDNNEMNTQEQTNEQPQVEQVQETQAQETKVVEPVTQTTGQVQSNAQVVTDYNQNLEEPMSIGEWLITMLIMCIPCVRIIMIFIWAFGDGKKSKKNFFKAALIMAAIMFVLSIVISILTWGTLTSFMDDVWWELQYLM